MMDAIRRHLARRREAAIRRRIERSGFFDRDFYLAHNQDVAAAGFDPLSHFIASGADEGRSPAARFDIDAYRRDNPSVIGSGVNPVIDWLDIGAAGGRKPPRPAAQTRTVRAEFERVPESDAALRKAALEAGLFDEAYYRAVRPDLEQAGIDPFDHYAHRGHRESRSPSATFDGHFYAREQGTDPSVPAGPLAHYLRVGRAAGHPIRPPHALTLSPAEEGPVSSASVAIHLHLVAAEAAETFAACLKGIGFGYDLYVSTLTQPDAAFARNLFGRLLPGRKLLVRCFPRSADPVPFLTGFPEIWRAYDFALHLRSQGGDRDFDGEWSDWTLGHLLGDPGIATAALHELERNPALATLFPDDLYRLKARRPAPEEEAAARALLRRLGIAADALPLPAFAAGSTGWFRVAAFAPLIHRLGSADIGPDAESLAALSHLALPLHAAAQGFANAPYYLRRPPKLAAIEGLHAALAGRERVGLRWRDDPAAVRAVPLASRLMRHNPAALEIAWLLPDAGQASTACGAFFRTVAALDARGHRQTLWVAEPGGSETTRALEAAIVDAHGAIGERVALRFLPDDRRQLSGDVVVATDRDIAHAAAAASGFKVRFAVPPAEDATLPGAAGFVTLAGGAETPESARAIEAAVLERLSEVGSVPLDPAELAAPAVMARVGASVVIPTYNGGALFREVLARVARQECDFAYDVLVLDSGSSDGTAAFARDFGGRVRVHEIANADFQHGRTRNLGISLTEGEFAVLVTQDALPADAHWLRHLVGGFALGPAVAGVIGRHRAYPQHNPFMARDIERMFDRIADLGPVFSLDRGLPRFIPRGGLDWRLLMHFYSDNNSAMRRSVWREIPYPEIEWGEDQLWAWEVLELGFAKAYVDEAVVFHSHDFPAERQLQVGVAEGRFFAEHFGYDLHPDGLDPFFLDAQERAARLEATRRGLPRAAVDAYVAGLRATIEGRVLGAREVRRD